jgi:AcrR family transcriptional regulator
LDKNIQKDRMKKYFIDAAKKILLNEGGANVSVRKVGKATGYSYATIYNYFKNLDHLLWCIGIDFKQDIIKIFESDLSKEQYSTEDFKNHLIKYVDYYFANPNVFKFFFFYEIEEPLEVIEVENTNPSIEIIQIKMLKYLAEKNVIEHEKVTIISSLIMNSVHGMLLMYFSKKRKITEQEIYNKIEEMVQFLLGEQ